ncbi:MAG: hypothetical protein F6K31_09205 [Symploca sp. SIO2G7]|nr:hypothetical protein [Symploca sp. SIO2G7]
MEKLKEKRKIVVLLPQLPISLSPYLPTSLSPRHRVTASGASLDNDTFTLTCHQWVLSGRW